MDIVALVIVVATLWIAQAFGLARLMSGRGFHPLPWLAVGLLLGPAMWPLAVVDLVTGPPGPVLVRGGRAGKGSLEAFVAFQRDALTDQAADQLRRLRPRCAHLVLARVFRSGGPTFIASDSERFLCDTAARLGAPDAELRLYHGVFERVLSEVREGGEFDLVLRSEQLGELFVGDGSRPETRCQRDVTAA